MQIEQSDNIQLPKIFGSEDKDERGKLHRDREILQCNTVSGITSPRVCCSCISSTESMNEIVF